MYRKMLFLALVVLLVNEAAIGATVYPWSTVITNISFNWGTHRSDATGSDNWPITWHDDGHQYAAYGDGWGFSQSGLKHSNGFSRIEGGKVGYVGYDIAEPFTGKCHGIISIDGTLYAWRDGNASGESAYDFTELWKSTNDGSTWSYTGVKFQQSDFNPPSDRGFFCTGFCQFGQSYAGARDNYVYMIATNIKRTDWQVQYPGEIIMMRVHKSNIENEGSYEFFDGMSGDNPTWTSDRMTREPIWQDSTNGVHRITISYNAPLGRYFLWTEHTARNSGNTAIYEAPESWGPWKTVLFDYDFAAPITSGKGCIFLNFSNKWLSGDGKDFVAVMSVDDNWDTVEGSFTVASSSLTASISAPSDGSEHWFGEPVTLEGSASGGTPPYTYTWSSDVDGTLGTGATLVISDLGVHRVGSTVQPYNITLTVEDAATDSDNDSIGITFFFHGDFEPDGDVDLDDYAVFADDWYLQSSGGEDTTSTSFEAAQGYSLGVLDGVQPTSINADGPGWTTLWYKDGGSSISVVAGGAPWGGSRHMQGSTHTIRREFEEYLSGLVFVSMKVRLDDAASPFSGEARFQLEETGGVDGVDFSVFNAANFIRVRTSAGDQEINPDPDLPTNTWFDLVFTVDIDNDLQKIQYSTVLGEALNTLEYTTGNPWFPLESAVSNIGRITVNGSADAVNWDDISIAPEPSLGPVDSPANFNDDEIVDFKDLKIFVKDWLEEGY